MSRPCAPPSSHSPPLDARRLDNLRAAAMPPATMSDRPFLEPAPRLGGEKGIGGTAILAMSGRTCSVGCMHARAITIGLAGWRPVVDEIVSKREASWSGIRTSRVMGNGGGRDAGGWVLLRKSVGRVWANGSAVMFCKRRNGVKRRRASTPSAAIGRQGPCRPQPCIWRRRQGKAPICVCVCLPWVRGMACRRSSRAFCLDFGLGEGALGP